MQKQKKTKKTKKLENWSKIEGIICSLTIYKSTYFCG